MNTFISTKDIVKKMNRRILGGTKTPHSNSFPVLRKEEGEIVIAIFTQMHTKEQLQMKVMQRPIYWCYADIGDGENFKGHYCKEVDFCSASFDRLYPKKEPKTVGTKEDVEDLYKRLDVIRKRYIDTKILDALSYQDFLAKLFAIIPSGQLNFYKELSKMI